MHVNFKVEKFRFEKMLYIWLEQKSLFEEIFGQKYVQVYCKHTERCSAKSLNLFLKNIGRCYTKYAKGWQSISQKRLITDRQCYFPYHCSGDINNFCLAEGGNLHVPFRTHLFVWRQSISQWIFLLQMEGKEKAILCKMTLENKLRIKE